MESTTRPAAQKNAGSSGLDDKSSSPKPSTQTSSHHTLLKGTQLYGSRILSPKYGNQKTGYGMSLQVPKYGMRADYQNCFLRLLRQASNHLLHLMFLALRALRALQVLRLLFGVEFSGHLRSNDLGHSWPQDCLTEPRTASQSFTSC